MRQHRGMLSPHLRWEWVEGRDLISPDPSLKRQALLFICPSATGRHFACFILLTGKQSPALTSTSLYFPAYQLLNGLFKASR